MELQGTFPVFLAEKLSLVGGNCNQIQCLSLAHCWGYSPTGVCGYLPLTLGQESLWNGDDPFCACLHGWALAKEVLMETGLQENKGE